MGVKFYRMFAGELDGVLVLGHIALTARDVRESISELFFGQGEGPQPKVWLSYSPEGKKRRWRAAVKAGWRVVPLSITKYTGGKPRRRAPYVGIDIMNRGTE